MANSGSYIDELKTELGHTDPSSHANRLLTQEIDRLTKGEEIKTEPEKKDRNAMPYLEIHHDKPTRCLLKIRVPVKEFPKYNFVGKLLGPKGNTLKGLQDVTGCKMAIMGRGSMRDKDKEEELRKSGGKYAHLNEELHVLVECFAEGVEGQHRMAGALIELKKYLIPELNDMDGAGDGSYEMGMNGASRGRGGFRGGPADRARGGFRGRGSGPAGPPGGGRGASMGRGGPPPRGGPRGGPAVGRGGPAGRGAPAARGGRVPAPPPAEYDSYGTQQQGYGSGGYESGYGTSYDDSYGHDAYYDYNQTSSASTGYDSYSAGGYGDYSESWSTGGASAAGGMAGGKAAPARGAGRGARAHPYNRPAATGY